MTTSSQASALLSLSRDGRRIVFAVSDSRTNLERIALDPAAGRVTGDRGAGHQERARHPLLPRLARRPVDRLPLDRAAGGPLRGPRGRHAACASSPTTAHNDRHPHWSPDGSRILFYSNRSGRYEAWTIRPEGSGLRAAHDEPEGGSSSIPSGLRTGGGSPSPGRAGAR